MRYVALIFAFTALLVGCAHAPSEPVVPTAQDAIRAALAKIPGNGKIKHIVFIVQENRTFDNIFGGPNPLKGADTVASGKDINGNKVDLTEVHLENDVGYGDPNNYHFQWLKACNATIPTPWPTGKPAPCRMNGFSLNAMQQPAYPAPPGINYKDSLAYIYSYVRQDETAPYFFIAEHYGVSDRFFMGHNSESFTGHQYIFYSQSNKVVDDPVFPSGFDCSLKYDHCAYTPWGCDSPQGTLTYSLNSVTGAWNGPSAPPDWKPPCFGSGKNGVTSYESLADLAQAKALPWRLYAYSMCSGIVALDTDWTLRKSNLWPVPNGQMKNCHDNYGIESPLKAATQHFRAPQYEFLADELPNSKYPLAAITWLLPGAFTSDHPGVPGGYCGPEWVTRAINAIGANTADWNSTVIFVFWDDWGGFYDHVPPYVVRDQAGPGFRVPLLVLSAYTPAGHIDHVPTEFATLNKFAEDTFGLDSLGATDASPYLGNLSGFFNFNQKPQKFQPIPDQGYFSCRYLKDGTFAGPRLPGARASRWLQIDGDGD